MSLSCLVTGEAQSLTYTSLQKIGLDSTYVYNKVDSIMTLGITQNAFPGAQVLVAKDGKVVFHEAYGFHTYDSLQKVQLDDVYDLASVTKITGPLPALMKLYEEGKLDLDAPFSKYWLSWKHKKDKKKLTLREILAHQAGLQPYIVFVSEVIKKNGKLKKRFVSTYFSKKHTVQTYEGLYLNKRFINKVYRKIKRSKVSTEKVYKYSGLSFLIYPQLIENITGIPYEEYVTNTFYKPLGCNTLVFNPIKKNITNTIVPTEQDSVYRKAIVKGWVHDENAALLGGVSGNAGLFGSATDLAKIMLMYNQKGTFNGKQYLKPETVEEFIRIQYPENNNRRGLGFDKPLINNDTLSIKEAYPAPEVSPKSFGHAGFTGTFVWADPENNLVFIFLSNRVYPTRTHRNLYNLNIRPALQQVFYKAISNTNN